MHNPTDQFIVKKWFNMSAWGFDLSLTNSSFVMLLSTLAICTIMFYTTRNIQKIPARKQVFGEYLYNFIRDIVEKHAGKHALKYMPVVMMVFLMVLFGNMLGMVPGFYTYTSQVVVTTFLAMIVLLTVVVVGLIEQGTGFFRLFAPRNVPVPIMIFMIPIEIVSFIAKPISLSLRLCINMIAGHMMLKIFAGFASSVPATSVIIIPVLIAITVFELAIAGLQAYIFTILTCIYLHDAVEGH